MVDDTTLPLTATAAEISIAITVVQRRARVNTADPQRLASLVRRQLDRCEAMAMAVGVPLQDLQPSMQAWEGQMHCDSFTTTVVSVTSYGIKIHRGQPWGTAACGLVHLGLRAEKAVP